MPEGLKRRVFAEYDVPGNNEGACGVTEEAQTMIANDWIAAYKAIFRTDEP